MKIYEFIDNDCQELIGKDFNNIILLTADDTKTSMTLRADEYKLMVLLGNLAEVALMNCKKEFFLLAFLKLVETLVNDRIAELKGEIK